MRLRRRSALRRRFTANGRVRTARFAVVGDVHPNVADVAGALTPVPGGVGPLTIAMLLKNTLAAAEGRRARSLTHVESRADRRHRDGQEFLPARVSPRSACRSSTPTCSHVTPLRRARRGSRAIAARFGPSVILRGRPARSCCARLLVFADRAARAELEAIVHPEVYRRINEWFAARPAGTRFAIADIPLLFETGQEHDYDRVIVCACAPAEQFRRLDVPGRPVGGSRTRAPGGAVADRRKGRLAPTTSSGPMATSHETSEQVQQGLRR